MGGTADSPFRAGWAPSEPRPGNGLSFASASAPDSDCLDAYQVMTRAHPIGHEKIGPWNTLFRILTVTDHLCHY